MLWEAVERPLPGDGQVVEAPQGLRLPRYLKPERGVKVLHGAALATLFHTPRFSLLITSRLTSAFVKSFFTLSFLASSTSHLEAG